MTPELRELFARLAPMEAADRTAELDRLAPDPDLRLRLEELLKADCLTDGMIHRPIRNAAAALADQAAGFELGVWRTTGLIGQGGMGVIYRAKRADGTVEQTAAIKLLYRGLETEDLLNRFQRERSILARLSHPNIARFLDAGATREGLPWFAMEFVDGVAIDRYCREGNLSGEARVRLLIEVCGAVQHAHRHLVIHRDIKPDNILVTEEGTPILLDFGIAQILGEARPGAPVTRALTPDYASPEQLRGEPATTSTDVYLLGAVLGRILVNPPAGDLANIVHRAMHEDPARRYATPAEFATDLGAWLDGRPVSATTDSLLYRTGRFIARHRWSVALAALAFLATAASALIAVNQARNAQRQFRDVRALANVFLFDFETAIHNLEGASKARELVITTAQKYLHGLSTQDDRDPTLQRELADAWAKLGRLQSGSTFSSTAHLTEGIDSYNKSLELRRKLGDDRSANPELRRAYLVLVNSLVNALVISQRGAEAVPVSLAAVENAEAFLKAMPASRDATRSVYIAYHSRSLLCLEVSDAACAVASANRSLNVIRDWGSKHPGDRRIELDTCAAELYVAQAAILYGDYRVAREVARGMVSRAANVEKQFPGTPESRRNMLFAWQILGSSLAASSAELPSIPDEAVATLRKAVALATAIRDKDLNNTLAAEDLFLSRSLLGNALTKSDPAGAIVVLEGLRTEALGFIDKHPDDFTVQKTLADIHNDLGEALRLSHRPQPALEEHLSSLALSNRILAKSPADAISRKARIIGLIRSARAEFDLKRPDEALAHADEALQALTAMKKASPTDATLANLSMEARAVLEKTGKQSR